VQLIYQAINQETKKEIARALTTMIFYDNQKSKVSKIPQKFLSILE
jgi:acyl-CoA thioesterase FadM